MSNLIRAVHGAASGLTDHERGVLLGDCIDAVAHRDGLTFEAAAELLDRAADRGAVHLVGDAERVAVTVDGLRLVELSRAELRELAGEERRFEAWIAQQLGDHDLALMGAR